MALSLSSADIAALERANTVLLAPFSYETGESWRRAAARAIEECLGGGASSFALPVTGEPLLAATPDVMRALEAVDPPPEWVVEGLTVRRRALGLTVTDWEELFDARQVRQTPFYNEVVRPQRLLAPLVMVRETGVGNIPAALSVYFADEQSARRQMHRRKELLRLLFPAFCAGLRTYIGFRRNCAQLTALAEDAAIGVVFLDSRGRLSRENQFFQRLMESELERDFVRAEIAHMIRACVQLTSLRGESTERRRQTSEIRTTIARYKVAVTFLEDQSSGNSVKAVALIERIERRPLGARELAGRFYLTPREIEAAQLLRGGLSSRQIASELGISVNTVRRHIERVLLKLDVHTRTAAAAKLSGI